MARIIRSPFPPPVDATGAERDLTEAEVAEIERYFAAQLAAMPSLIELSIYGVGLLVVCAAALIVGLS